MLRTRNVNIIGNHHLWGCHSWTFVVVAPDYHDNMTSPPTEGSRGYSASVDMAPLPQPCPLTSPSGALSRSSWCAGLLQPDLPPLIAPSRTLPTWTSIARGCPAPSMKPPLLPQPTLPTSAALLQDSKLDFRWRISLVTRRFTSFVDSPTRPLHTLFRPVITNDSVGEITAGLRPAQVALKPNRHPQLSCLAALPCASTSLAQNPLTNGATTSKENAKTSMWARAPQKLRWWPRAAPGHLSTSTIVIIASEVVATWA